jgi:hypothetical protein
MKYTTPELTVLPTAILAIQGTSGSGEKAGPVVADSMEPHKEIQSGFMDWEQ